MHVHMIILVTRAENTNCLLIFSPGDGYAHNLPFNTFSGYSGSTVSSCGIARKIEFSSTKSPLVAKYTVLVGYTYRC